MAFRADTWVRPYTTRTLVLAQAGIPDQYEASEPKISACSASLR